MIVDISFYQRDALIVAPELLGCYLVTEKQEGTTIVRIVEVEVYLQDDKAAHSYRGETERTRALFGDGGHAYIYFTYGMHYCFNIATSVKGRGEGILIRAGEPVEGIEIMRQRRGKHNQIDLANGPAKLVQALGITKSDYGHDMSTGNLYVLSKDHFGPPERFAIVTTTRVGISEDKDLPYRFYIEGNPFVSRTK